MIKQTELKSLFSVFIDNEVVTEEIIIKNFNGSQISNFLKEGVISKFGYAYILKRAYLEQLFNYGKSLIVSKEYNKALKCYNLCKKLGYESQKLDLQIFLANVKLKNMDEYLNFFNEKLKKRGNTIYFYLYLVSCIIELPENYQKIVEKYIYKYRIDTSNSQEDKLYEVKIAAIDYKFNLAATLLKEFYKTDHDWKHNFTLTLLLELMKQAEEKTYTLSKIKTCLKDQDNIAAETLIRGYLLNKHKIEYLSILLDLLKLDLYSTIINILTNIENEEQIDINLSEIDNLVNKAVNEKNYYLIKSIVKILNKMNEMNLTSIVSTKYENILKLS